jgi:spermidine synthase
MNSVDTFAGRELARAGVAFLLLCVPTTFMGLTFPLLLQRIARRGDIGALVGKLTAINTLGAVLGSLCTGYLLLPLLGSERALIVLSMIFAAMGLWASLEVTGGIKRVGRGLILASAILAVALPRWDIGRLSSGTNL